MGVTEKQRNRITNVRSSGFSLCANNYHVEQEGCLRPVNPTWQDAVAMSVPALFFNVTKPDSPDSRPTKAIFS